MSKQYKCFACEHFEIFMEDIYIMGTDCELGNKICEDGCDDFQDVFAGMFDDVEDNDNISDDMEIPF